MSIALGLICLVVGILIGAVGIGGVLLVPALTYIGDISVHQAIPACMLSFLPVGIVAVLVYARKGSMRWDLVLWLCLSAIPAAFLGSMVLPFIPSSVVMLLIVALMIFAGVDALFKSYRIPEPRGDARALARWQFALIGFVTGFGSSITGTGGPLILVPVLIYLGMPMLIAVGLSQAIQVPIAAFASIGNWATGNLDPTLALPIAVAMVIGTVAGAMLIHRLPTEPMRKVIAYMLVIVGLGIGLRILLAW